MRTPCPMYVVRSCVVSSARMHIGRQVVVQIAAEQQVLADAAGDPGRRLRSSCWPVKRWKSSRGAAWSGDLRPAALAVHRWHAAVP